MSVSENVAAGQGPDITVIIPHFDDHDNLAACLQLLRHQTLGPERYEIIVADNNSLGSRHRLEAICRSVRLVAAPIQGAAEARNAGVAAATTPLLAFLDSDCRPGLKWLQAGMEALTARPLVGGSIGVCVHDVRRMTPTEAFERIFAFNNERYIREENFSVTANMFTTRAVFDHVGGFRNGVSEDREWGQRAAALGYAWHYAPDACLEHPARRTWAELTRKWKRLMRESFLLDRERGHGRARWIARNWLVVLSIPIAVTKALASGEVPAGADRVRAATVMVRLRLWRFVEAHRLAVRSLVRATAS